jgi:hypothetical protein
MQSSINFYVGGVIMNKTYFFQTKRMLVFLMLLTQCGVWVLLPTAPSRAAELVPYADEVVGFSAIAGTWRSDDGNRVFHFKPDGSFVSEIHIEQKYLPSILEKILSRPLPGTYIVVSRNRLRLSFDINYLMVAGVTGLMVVPPQEVDENIIGTPKVLTGMACLAAIPRVDMVVTGPDQMIEDNSFCFGLWHTSGTVFYRE